MMTGGWLSGSDFSHYAWHSTNSPKTVRRVVIGDSTMKEESGATSSHILADSGDTLPFYDKNSYDDITLLHRRRHFQFIVSIASLILLFICVLYVMWLFETHLTNHESKSLWHISSSDSNSGDVSSAQLIAKCKQVRDVALMYINIIDNPPCKLPVYSPFVSKRREDAPLGQCFSSHTDWNSDTQSFTMKCPHAHHVPMYYTSNDYQFNNADANRDNWKLYPSEDLSAILVATQSSMETPLLDGFIPSMKPPISTLGASVIQTACVDTKKGVSYHNFFVQTVRNETMVKSKKEILSTLLQRPVAELSGATLQKQPPNIHVVLIDGASRDWFYRHFPHTTDYLNEMKQMKNSPFGIYDLTNTMVLGYNSIPNMHAFITGKSVKSGETQDVLVRRIRDQNASDHTPAIWDDLKKLGYVTTIGEDAGESGVATLYGTKRQPRSFDTYPAFHVVAHRVNIDQGYYFNYNPRVCPCAGQRFMSDLVLDWTRSHMTAYSDLPNFIVSTSHEVHDTFSRQSVTLDPNVKRHLQWFVETGRLENSVVVLMADHGIHYGPIFAHEEMARFEHENPFVLFIMPNHLTTDTFKSNVDKLVTLKDIYMTLRDIASFPVKSTEGNTRTDALSMLHDTIPEDRTCEDIQSHPDFSTSCNSPRRRRGKR